MSVVFPLAPPAGTPGVPNVQRTAGSTQPPTAALTSDSPAILQLGNGPKWGIYDSSGALAVTPDSFVSMSVRKDQRVADYPIESGGFASYDKVDLPVQIKVQVSKGGTNVDRLKFMEQIATMSESMDLYSIVMPESPINSYTVEHYDFERRAEAGAFLLLVDIWFKEINVIGSNVFVATATPDGASPANTGVAQPQAAVTLVSMVPALTSGLTTLSNSLAVVTSQLSSIATLGASALGSIASTALSTIAGNLSFATSLMAGYVASIPLVGSTLLATNLLNAGYLVGSLGSQLSLATSYLSSLTPSITIGIPGLPGLVASASPLLDNASATVGMLSENLIDASSLVTGGAVLQSGPTFSAGSAVANALGSTSGPISTGGYTFGPVLNGPSFPAGSATANALDANSGVVNSGGYTFGPVFTTSALAT